ncbi:RebB family R body protein [Allorhizobium sp. BGMRC 0089]|uniref:RebB family R body protein n=1 Tax=Allorhizobium sonneratiae TaxID=2934936 RepID=UPI0020348B3C|nr:RebB family R body protein [Allorhizobium sonneratiae]MCM2290794.1 RebB family R body protein [Allorhizobium sonneratiae]
MSTTTNPSSNSTVIAESPNVAVSIFYQAAGQAYSLSMQNASSNQQNVNSLAPSIIANALAMLNK